MKKVIVYLMVLLMIVGCTKTSNNEVDDQNKETINNQEFLKEKLIIEVNNQEVIINLYDNDLSKQLLDSLPIDCSFTDYNNCEKAADIQDVIDTSNVDLGYEPQIGDVVVYAPLG